MALVRTGEAVAAGTDIGYCCHRCHLKLLAAVQLVASWELSCFGLVVRDVGGGGCGAAGGAAGGADCGAVGGDVAIVAGGCC